MIRQLKDFLNMENILDTQYGGSVLCVTRYFPTLDPTKYNPYLIEILNTNNDSLTLDYLGNRLDKCLSPLYNRLIDYYKDTDVPAGTDPIYYGVTLANAKLRKIILE